MLLLLANLGFAGGFATVSIPEFVPRKKAGSAKRRRRMLVEVDGQTFEVASVKEAEHVLSQARDLAEQTARVDITRAVQTHKPVKVPQVRTAVKALKPVVAKANKAIRQTYNVVQKEVSRDAEIAQLLHSKIRQEDEDDALAVLLL